MIKTVRTIATLAIIACSVCAGCATGGMPGSSLVDGIANWQAPRMNVHETMDEPQPYSLTQSPRRYANACRTGSS